MEKLSPFMSGEISEFTIRDTERELTGAGTNEECFACIKHFIEQSKSKMSIDLMWCGMSGFTPDGDVRFMDDPIVDVTPEEPGVEFEDRFCSNDDYAYKVIRGLMLQDTEVDDPFSIDF